MVDLHASPSQPQSMSEPRFINNYEALRDIEAGGVSCELKIVHLKLNESLTLTLSQRQNVRRLRHDG
jgi:hypothetical protein